MSVVEKKFESYFRDRLTFSNVDSRTSRRIYRLALLLCAPETLSSLSKSRISIFNAHLTLLVRKMTSHNSIGYIVITPHAQCERGKVIGRGVHIYNIIYKTYYTGQRVI